MTDRARAEALRQEWAGRQRALAQRLGHRALSDLESGTIVVVPSITFPVSELAKITAARFYEERLLFLVLLLGRPRLRLVYVTSVAVDPAVVDYHLGLLADPAGARSRLSLVSLDDPAPLPLSEKLVDRPDALDAVAAAAGDPDDACVLTFNVTPAELAVCQALGLPLYGPMPDVAARLGSKSGARQAARRAGVAVPVGAEDLFSVPALEAAVAQIRSRRPAAEGVVIKLNHGFSGQGSAVVDVDVDGQGPGAAVRLVSAPTTFCAEEESWPTFAAKVEAEGAIVEELLRQPGTASPSVQLHVSPAGSFEVVSTHDQVLGGPGNQVYVGCRFPADPSYRTAIQEEALRVAAVLAAEGVVGSFGIDFLVTPGGEVYLSEINLRMGGTTHPFWMARLATGGSYDAASGCLVAGGSPVSYVATDNFKSPGLVGRSPGDVIAAVADAGLAFDPRTRSGATLHLLGAVPEYGKVGATCIAGRADDADDLYRRVAALLVG